MIMFILKKVGTCCEQQNVEICFFGQILDNPDMKNCTFKHIFFTQLCTKNCQIHKVRCYSDII